MPDFLPERPRTGYLSDMSQLMTEEGAGVDQALGELIHVLMRRQGISQKTLGGLLGIDQTAVSRKLRGTRPFFVPELYTVADVLGIHVAQLVGGEPPETWRARRDLISVNPGLTADRSAGPAPTGHLRAVS